MFQEGIAVSDRTRIPESLLNSVEKRTSSALCLWKTWVIGAASKSGAETKVDIRVFWRSVSVVSGTIRGKSGKQNKEKSNVRSRAIRKID